MAQLSNVCRRIFLNSVVQRSGRLLYVRQISSSGKKDESEKPCEQQAIFKKVPDFSKPDTENWISYGFSEHDKEEDRFKLHASFFLMISVFLCGSMFIYYYFPDRERNDWALREAFIRLHEREQLGLDPIDKNFIDPSKIILPPDNELRDDEIVI